MGRQQIKCHGDDSRFEVVADFIYNTYGDSVKYIADVAGGQGLLSRILNKKYNYESEVIDPRGFALKGVPSRQCEYTSDMAGFYDLIVGVHPDEATRPVAESALQRPVIVIPCCNFWDTTRKLGTIALADAVCEYFDQKSVKYERCNLPFKGPKNICIYTGR